MVPLAGFEPIVAPDCRAVVLGSFPGVASLNAGHYYAHPRNQFWRIVGDVFDTELTDLPFGERYQFLQSRGLGLWDVIAQCERSGSLDSDIRQALPSQLGSLRELAPDLGALLLNGRKAQAGARDMAPEHVELFNLPSTSPAHASASYETKLAQWRDALHRALA